MVVRAPAFDRLTTNDQRRWLRPLKIDDYNRLEGLSFTVADVGAIAPLLYGLDGGGCQGSIALDQSHAFHFAVLIDDLFEDYRSLRLRLPPRFDGKVGLNAVSQPPFRALGGENDRAVFPGQLGGGYEGSGGIFLAVGGLADLRLGDDRCRCGGGRRSWSRNFRAWGGYGLDGSRSG